MDCAGIFRQIKGEDKVNITDRKPRFAESALS